ncbi:MAG: hypothetical protein WBQ43_16775 [Terriglobales bacterium]
MPRPFQALCFLIVSSALWLLTPVSSQAEAPALVTFTLDFPSSQPEHYSIRIPSDGEARYQSSARVSADSDDTDFHGEDKDKDKDNDSFDLTFTLAAETRQKIFDLAAKGAYFQKDVDSHRKGMAFTGKKTLGYKDAQRSGESTYNYSNIPAVQELTTLLQSLSATLEFGHRLQYDHHYQKLALDEELKRMEEMAHSHQLTEVAAIHPILDQIIADPSVMNIARARAQRLLQGAGVH